MNSLVSRKHAELRWENDHLHDVDLDSFNGTYVNSKAGRSAILVHGDELQLGKSPEIGRFSVYCLCDG